MGFWISFLSPHPQRYPPAPTVSRSLKPGIRQLVKHVDDWETMEKSEKQKFFNPEDFEIANLKGVKIFISGNYYTGAALVFLNLKNCFIYSEIWSGQVHIEGCRDSCFRLSTTGSLSLRHSERCQLSVASKQFRSYEIAFCTAQLSCRTCPSIEKCFTPK